MIAASVVLLAWHANAQSNSNEPIQQPTPQEYLAELAGKDFELLSKIIWCESGWKPLAKNPNSTASGLFQFIASTWNSWGEGNVFDSYDNIRAGVKLYQAQGTRPWLESKSCWQ